MEIALLSVTSLAILACYVLARVLEGKISRILSVTSVALHPVLLLSLFLVGVGLETVSLVLTADLLSALVIRTAFAGKGERP